MRFIVYGILIAQSLTILYLTSLMQERPFSNSNMRSAFYSGCTQGQHYIESTKFTCSSSADTYEYYLNKLDEQMNND